MAAFAWETPQLDLHALAPELIVVGVLSLVLIVDAFTDESGRWLSSTIAGIGLLVAAIPLVTLAMDGTDRVMFGGAYVVDDFALVLKALFLASAYVVVLLSTNYIAEGDYWEGEYYQVLLGSVVGMLVMASSRDLVTMFVALEMLSIPAYTLAAWRKRDSKGNEAGLKYYLMGVFASAILLYGMSLLFGLTGTTVLAEIGEVVGGAADTQPIVTLAIVFVIIGFAFKVSAVPFHTWAPDTYEGAPTPITAFLAVASKAAGFVALLQLVFIALYGREDVYGPLIWVLAAVTMTVGNLIALRQTNVVRMLAYSGIAQAGYILAPLAIAGTGGDVGLTSLQAIVVYLLIYAAMNLGAFAVVIAVARKTRSAELSSFGGLFSYAPALTVCMTLFLFALAGIPPAAGWFGKLEIFRALASAGNFSGYSLAVLVAVNSVVAFAYYGRLMRVMWMDDAPDGDVTPIRVPPSLVAAVSITAVLTLAVGVFPRAFTHFTESVTLLGLGG
nr:NADH-quinone oxidoreductase subunit N [Rhabdothermincola salaria]